METCGIQKNKEVKKIQKGPLEGSAEKENDC